MKEKEVKLTWEELAKHNTQDSLYVAIRGKIYDVTKFIKYHPGGMEALLVGAGRDCTLVFETYHELNSIDELLSKYEIGTLVTDELPIFPKPNQFHRELKSKVYEYFKSNGKDPKVPNMSELWLRYSIIFAGLISSYLIYILPVINNTWLNLIISNLILGFFCAQVGLHPLHDSSHFSITHNPKLWRLLGMTHDFFNGSSNLVWIYQHMLGHHPYTNIPDADPDISINDPDIRRILPNQKYLERYLGQESYVPILYGFLALKTRLQDIKIVYLNKKNASIRINPLTWDQHLIFWGGKSFFLFYRILLPYYLLGFAKMAIALIISDLVSSYWLAITFQVNHVTSSVEYVNLPKGDDKDIKNSKLISMDWAELQLKTTQDYAHNSFWWTLLTGGLNYQTVHHIFPNIHQSYYPELARVVIKICKDFQVDYIVQGTFSEAFDTHYDLLKQLGLGSELKPYKAQ